MRRIDLYVVREILGPFGLGFAVYTFMFLLQLILKSADLFLTTEVPLKLILELILYSLPSILVLVIPVSFLVGILLGIGRLSGDSELIALRASGCSYFRILMPLLFLSLIATGISMHLMLDVLPASNARLAELRLEILSQSVREKVVPRTAFTGIPGKTLVVFGIRKAEWEGVFIANNSLTANELTVAERATAELNSEQRLRLQLENAYSHSTALTDPKSYKILFQRQGDTTWADAVGIGSTASVKRGLRELSLRELKVREQDSTLSPEVRRLATVERHKRFGFPAACIVFALIGLPFASSTARSGKSSGFALSIIFVFVYYLIFNGLEEGARSGIVPPAAAAWFPNILFGLIGFFSIRAKDHRSESFLRFKQVASAKWNVLVSYLKRLTGIRKRKSRKADDSSEKEVLLRLNFSAPKFLGIVDGYITRGFVSVFLLTLFSCIALFLIADFTENIDDISRNDPEAKVVISYYAIRSLLISFEILPLVVLIAVLLHTASLARGNELVAFKASGISFFRISLPILLICIAIAGGWGWLHSEVFPRGASLAGEKLAIIKGKTAEKRDLTDRWLVGRDNSLLNFSSFDPVSNQLSNLQLFTFDEQFRLISRVFATRAQFIQGHDWLIEGWWAKRFTDGTGSTLTSQEPPARIDLEQTLDDFKGRAKTPDEMYFGELSQHIKELRAMGRETLALEIALVKRITYPFLAIAMSIIALPFGFRVGKKGAYSSLGISILMGMLLMVTSGLFEALGQSGMLPTVLAAWAPAGLFTLAGLYFFLGIRS